MLLRVPSEKDGASGNVLCLGPSNCFWGYCVGVGHYNENTNKTADSDFSQLKSKHFESVIHETSMEAKETERNDVVTVSQTSPVV